MNNLALKMEDTYTYADYLTWDGPERYELIEGQPVMMPSPRRRHQRVMVALVAQLYEFLRDKPCEVYAAPLDVRLFEKAGDHPEDVDTVVQPDVMVVCHADRLDDAGVRGAPDLVIEILSPSSRRHDLVRKFNLYLRAGVREYWVIDPDNNTAQSWVLHDGHYEARESFMGGGQMPVAVLEGCQVDLDRVFAP